MEKTRSPSRDCFWQRNVSGNLWKTILQELMKKFIAYFDYLGFKQFIENNDFEYQKRIVINNFRDIESALGLGKLQKSAHGFISDLSNSNINCINFSDTIVFWTNDDSENSLIEILDVAYRFNWQAIDHFFPARGCLVYHEIEYVDFKRKNESGGIYNINSVFGKGLVLAHEKAEQQHWAGTVLHSSFIDEIINKGHEVEEYLKPYAKKFKVPYKKEFNLPEEYVLRLIKDDLNAEGFDNFKSHITRNFADHKKSIEFPDVQEKIENTINFLYSFVK